MKLSIIIPVYNVEKYIDKCLLSCLSQDVPLTDYEIIVINDGTKDRSLEIAQERTKDVPNVTIFSQENAGLSVARNKGLSMAKGDYVWFVDSDDYIETRCLGGIFSVLNESVDILQLQYRYIYEDGRPPKEVPKKIINNVCSGREITLRGGLPAQAQLTIFRRSFLLENNLLFEPGIYHEDSEFRPRAVYLAKRISSYNEIVYNYLIRTSGSIMSNFKLKNGLDLIYLCNKLYLFSRDLDPEIQSAFAGKIILNLNTMLDGMRSLNRQDRRCLINHLRENKELIKYLTKAKGLKRKIEARAFGVLVKFHKIF